MLTDCCIVVLQFHFATLSVWQYLNYTHPSSARSNALCTFWPFCVDSYNYTVLSVVAADISCRFSSALQIKVNGVVPLCSAQYERVFNTCRIPGVEVGKTVFFSSADKREE